MTVAICIQCGHEKVGALTPCRKCTFTPELLEDQAKSILLSDHCYSVAELRQIGQRITSGERPSFDESRIAAMVADMARLPKAKMPLGCQIAMWTPIVIMFILIAVLITLVIYIRTH